MARIIGELYWVVNSGLQSSLIHQGSPSDGITVFYHKQSEGSQNGTICSLLITLLFAAEAIMATLSGTKQATLFRRPDAASPFSLPTTFPMKGETGESLSVFVPLVIVHF